MREPGEGVMSGQVFDWVAQGVTLILVVYFGLHLRSQLRTLKATMETQKLTIEAQAEQMNAQSTVLQDFERHSKIMQQVIAFFGPEAQLRRGQAYKELVERDLKTLERELQRVNESLAAHKERVSLHENWLTTMVADMEEQIREMPEE